MNIRVLEKDNNARGDLFGKLMTDLFHCLGYADCRLNIHKSGREIDLQGRHRRESRYVVAECKATKDPIGGADVNKFAGALEVERRKLKTDVEGYFVSLGGFKETAVEQEDGLSRLNMLTGEQAVAELIRGRVLAPEAVASSVAGRLAPRGVDLILEATELLAHALGWVWALYFGHQGVRSHVCLIHADGNPLNATLAEQIVSSDATVGGSMNRLSIIAGPDADCEPEDALTRYREHLQAEYGYVTLEGLPADTQVGGKSRRLETLFVPMDVEELVSPPTRKRASERVPFNRVLEAESRIALVAAPGAGKSTLLKRLAVAYSSPERLSEGSDNLPARDWLPVVVRCRQLGELSRSTILEVIESLPARAELPELTSQFILAVTERLKTGNVLLLIDGLDEISDEADRLAFATQLRTFLATYPRARLVVSSREVGFRAVAGALASACVSYKLSELDDDDIRQLVSSWQIEFLGEGPRAFEASRLVASDILANDRVSALATNPLLLTTLLLVRRWLGELPRRRSALYGKAIEVLLMTWNVEGHDPLDQSEVLPQLSYVAFSMMAAGEQVLSAHRLAELLRDARNEMPEELEGCRISVQDFVSRVEERSSLLALAGHEVIDGQLRAVYEFRHLTFQEYLTALGVVNGWHPGRREEAEAVRVVSPYLEVDSWREVIPLVAVLAGRHAATVIRAVVAELTRETDEVESDDDWNRQQHLSGILRQCLADDAPITSDVASIAADAWIRGSDGMADVFDSPDIFTGRHSAVVREVAMAGLERFDTLAPRYGSVLGSSMVHSFSDGRPSMDRLRESLVASTDEKTTISLLCASMETSYMAAQRFSRPPLKEGRTASRRLAIVISELLRAYEGNIVVEFCGCWALAWLNTLVRWPNETKCGVFDTLCRIWMNSDVGSHHRRQAAWAIGELRPLDRIGVPPTGLESYLSTLSIRVADDDPTFRDNYAILVARWLVGVYSSTTDLIDDFAILGGVRRGHGLRPLVDALSKAGLDADPLLAMLETMTADLVVETERRGSAPSETPNESVAD